jgi:hypothetical protein
VFTARHIHRAALASGLTCVLLLTSVIGTAAAQDFRSPDTRDAARTSSLAGTVEPAQDLRSPDARDAAEGLLPGQPSWPGHFLQPAQDSQPAAPSDETPWLPIALIVVAGTAGAAHLHRLRIRRRLATP